MSRIPGYPSLAEEMAEQKRVDDLLTDIRYTTRLAGPAITDEALKGYAYGRGQKAGRQATEGLAGQDESTWIPIDVTAVPDPAPTSILRRTDGKALLYPGRVNIFFGESGSLKSWAAQLAAAEVLKADGNVLYLDYEDNASGLKARMQSFGIPDSWLRERFVYVRPDASASSENFKKLLSQTFTLCVIDGVTESMTTENLKLLDATDAATWNRLLPKRIADETGAAVVIIDHVPKGKDNQASPIGSEHKIAGLTGAAYHFEKKRSLGIPDDEPITGLSVITNRKDRVGYVDQWAGDSQSRQVWMLKLIAYPGDHSVKGTVEVPKAKDAINPVLVARIFATLSERGPSSMNTIERTTEGSSVTLRETVRAMVAEDWLSAVEANRGKQYRVTPAGERQWQELQKT